MKHSRVVRTPKYCMDSTGSITFTHEEETDNNSIPFFETHIHRRHDESVKVKLYLKKTTKSGLSKSLSEN